MPSAIFFGGRRINVPGAYSALDASALAATSPAAIGIVAMVGTAEGGAPQTVDSDLADATRAEKILQRYRSGNLRTAGQFLFSPSTDDATPNGASRVIGVKVNPATQSTLTLPDVGAADSLVVTSKDWGLFTSQINLAVAAGTDLGKKYTVVFEDTAEVFDDVGGVAAFTLLYTPSTGGYTTALASLTALHLQIVQTKVSVGLVAQRTAALGAPGVVRVVSSNAGDTTQTLTAYGLDGAGVPQTEVIALNGTTPVLGLKTFSEVMGSVLSATCLGTVLLTDTAGSPATLYSHATTVNTRGVLVLTNCPSTDAVTYSLDTTSATNIVLFGKSPTGAALAEKANFASTPVVGTAVFASGTVLALGSLSGSRTVTVTMTVTLATSAFSTVKKVVDRLNAFAGYTAAAVTPQATTMLLSTLDYPSSQSILSVTYSFTADILAAVTALSNGSSFVNATRAVNATKPPANTSASVFLSGGSEGTPDITDWQDCFTALKKRRVNTIVPLTNDPAVHALLAAHLVLRAGQLRSEANGYVGLGTNAGAGETKANIKTQLAALNTRHVSALAQEINRYDPDTGLATFYPPWMFAVVAAGMQAGGAVGEPLTFKRPTANDIRQDVSWTVEDDISEMIDRGLMVAEKRDGIGIRFVRSITTYTADDNVVYSEMSANAAADYAVYTFRTRLEAKVGQRGLAGSDAVIMGLASGVLGEMMADEIIVAWGSLSVEQVGDVFPVSVQLAPVLPINFIPATVHLVALRTAA